jgi:hypothetical protein
MYLLCIDLNTRSVSFVTFISLENIRCSYFTFSLGFFHFLFHAEAANRKQTVNIATRGTTGIRTKNWIQRLWIDYIDWRMTTFYETRHHLTCVVLSHTYTRSTSGGGNKMCIVLLCSREKIRIKCIAQTRNNVILNCLKQNVVDCI